MTILGVSEEDHLQFEISKLELGPGDVLVARTLRPLPSQASERVGAYLKRHLPNTKVMVIDCGLELSVVSRAEAKRLAKETA